MIIYIIGCILSYLHFWKISPIMGIRFNNFDKCVYLFFSLFSWVALLSDMILFYEYKKDRRKMKEKWTFKHKNKNL